MRVQACVKSQLLVLYPSLTIPQWLNAEFDSVLPSPLPLPQPVHCPHSCTMLPCRVCISAQMASWGTTSLEDVKLVSATRHNTQTHTLHEHTYPYSPPSTPPTLCTHTHTHTHTRTALMYTCSSTHQQPSHTNVTAILFNSVQTPSLKLLLFLNVFVSYCSLCSWCCQRALHQHRGL